MSRQKHYEGETPVTRTGSSKHTRWECRDHAVVISKYRKKAIYGPIRRNLAELVRRLASQRNCRIEEGPLVCDRVQMMISIPPKNPVSQVIGCIKGKSAIHFRRT